MKYERTLSSAAEWAKQNQLEAWVHAFLLSDGHNKPFSDGIKLEKRFFWGLYRMPLSLFHRCCGPEEEMEYRVPPDAWERHVQKMQNAILNDPDMPPLIVHYMIPQGQTEGIFLLNDGNTRHEAYTRLGIEKAHVIMWITTQHEAEHFLEHYAQHLE